MAIQQNQASRNICAALKYFHNIVLGRDYQIVEVAPDRIYVRDLTGNLRRWCEADEDNWERRWKNGSRKHWTSELKSTAKMEHKGAVASFREKTSPSLQITFLENGKIDIDLDFHGAKKGLLGLPSLFLHLSEALHNWVTRKKTDEEKMRLALIRRGIPERMLDS